MSKTPTHQKSDEDYARELDELERSVTSRKYARQPRPNVHNQLIGHNPFLQYNDINHFAQFNQPFQFTPDKMLNNFYVNNDEYNDEYNDNEYEYDNNYYNTKNINNNINKNDFLTGEKLTDFINSTFDEETPKQKTKEKGKEKEKINEEKKEEINNNIAPLSPEIIKALTKFGKKTNNLNCPICADIIKIDEEYYICYGTSNNTEGHYFHTACLHQALTYKLNCPVCQKKL